MATEIRRISKNAVEATVSENVGELQEPVKEPFLLGDRLGIGGWFWMGILAAQVAAKLIVRGDLSLIFQSLGEVKLSNLNVCERFQIRK